jgi:hypothetical protein
MDVIYYFGPLVSTIGLVLASYFFKPDEKSDAYLFHLQSMMRTGAWVVAWLVGPPVLVIIALEFLL